MSKVTAVIRREVVERVRTRTFLVTTFLFPFLMAAMLVLPALMMQGSERSVTIGLIDVSSNVGSEVVQALDAEKFSNGQPRYLVKRFPLTGSAEALLDSLIAHTGLAQNTTGQSFDGLLVVSDSILSLGTVRYYGSNVGSIEAMTRISELLRKVVTAARLRDAGIDPVLVDAAMGGVRLQTTKVTDGKATGESGTTSFILGYVMGFLLYFGVMIYGQQTATAVIEEKSSRIMEILASSLSPFQMLLGKVVGVGLVGLLQMGIWGGTGYLLTSQRATLARIFGLSADAVAALPIPSMSPALLTVFLAWFAMGFLLYGALYAGVGSICNTVQEVQQTGMPVMILIMVGFFSIFALLGDPNGSLGRIMSLIPFFAPMVMPVRFSLVAVSGWELMLSLILTLAAIIVCVWLAARIYRIGILSYGKRPSIRELLRWIS